MKTSFKPYLKIRLIGNTFFFGPGVKQLMRNIGETGSVSAACKKMQMSYSKGRKMISTLEKELGYELIHRDKGGQKGGSASVTEKGQRFLELFEAYESDVKEYANEAFLKYFSEK